MKIKKILLALCTVFAALCCAGCSSGNVQAPKLSEENLDGWTLCFRGAWLRDKSSFLEYDLKEIVENEGKVEIEYAYTGRILQLDVVACYRGVAPKRHHLFAPGQPLYREREEEGWTDCQTNNLPLQQKGEYAFTDSDLLDIDTLQKGSGGISYGGRIRLQLYVWVVEGGFV